MVEMAPGKSLTIPLYWHYWQLETEVLKLAGKHLHVIARKTLLQSPT
jgi:LysR family transcriptional regulator (chromosome initiation inhibitor)